MIASQALRELPLFSLLVFFFFFFFWWRDGDSQTLSRVSVDGGSVGFSERPKMDGKGKPQLMGSKVREYWKESRRSVMWWRPG
ncbi:hypothetical protein DL95DRAFT_118895 [Leptodontidium sp. 2 PMI_412]|nr:hypothetical protein DL95DRAFT_118895 [Leptodontidium sp. 2 PMI_412]